MDPRGFSESTERDLSERIAARLGSWSRAAAARLDVIPTQAEATPLS